MIRKYKTVRGLLSDKKRWCRGKMAMTARNSPCGFNDDNAVKFCLVGAIRRVYGLNPSPIERITLVLKELTRFEYIANFNDYSHTTHADIMKIVKAAKI